MVTYGHAGNVGDPEEEQSSPGRRIDAVRNVPLLTVCYSVLHCLHRERRQRCRRGQPG